MSPQLAYRISVGVMLLNHDWQVFIAQRSGLVDEFWQMPQGGVEPGENLLAAAARELQEEIGTNNVRFLAESKKWYCYDIPLNFLFKDSPYQGQKQKWFLAQFLGKDHEISLETAHPEFHAWKWSNINTLIEKVIPFKQELYINILDEFYPLISELQQVA